MLMKDTYIHPTAVVDKGANLGSHTVIWHFCHIMPGAHIGSACTLGQNVFVGNDVEIGDGVKIQNNVSVYQGVIIEDDVFIGPSAVFTNVNNPRAAVERKDEFQETRVGKGATIGANATIICGVRIGNYGFIGAGSVVTNDIPPYAQVVGNPARLSGWRSEAGEKLEFENGKAKCPRTGDLYIIEELVVRKI